MNLREQIIDLLNTRGAVKHTEILDYFDADPPGIISGIVAEALSELTMDNKIKRIEYTLPGSYTKRLIYFPYGTRIE